MKRAIKLFLSIIFLGIASKAVVEERRATGEDEKVAIKQLNKMGIKPGSYTLNFMSLKWENVCLQGVDPEGKSLFLRFSIDLKKPIKINKYNLETGDNVIFCDYVVSGFSTKKAFTIEGNKCRGDISFTKTGKLCSCTLAEDSVIDGVEISKNSRVYFRKEKGKVIESHGPQSGKTSLEQGLYWFNKGKPEKIDYDIPFNCDKLE